MAVVKNVNRHEIWLVSLDPVQGSEIRKTRPCLIISPDEMNQWLRTVIVAPMTTAKRDYPSRVSIHAAGKDGQVALDQIRTLDKIRLIRKLGVADTSTCRNVSNVLMEIFAF